MEPSGAQKPMVTAVQLSGEVWPVALLDVPASHGMGVVAPSAHQRPARQTLHVVWPSSSWYSPAGHLAHADAPSLAAIVPAAHGT